MRKLQTYIKKLASTPKQESTNIVYINPGDDVATKVLAIVGEEVNNQFLIIVNGGTYDVTESIILKNFIHWEFKFFPFFQNTDNSKVVDGIFYDNNNAIKIDFKGDVRIENANGSSLNPAIHLENSDSNLNGFSYKYSAMITLGNGTFTIGQEASNNIKANPSPSWDAGPGYFSLDFTRFRGSNDNGIFFASIQNGQNKGAVKNKPLKDSTNEFYLECSAGSQNFMMKPKKLSDGSNYTLLSDVTFKIDFEIRY